MWTVYPGGFGHAVTRHGTAPTEGLHCIACIGDLWTALDREAGGPLGALGEVLLIHAEKRPPSWMGFHLISRRTVRVRRAVDYMLRTHGYRVSVTVISAPETGVHGPHAFMQCKHARYGGTISYSCLLLVLDPPAWTSPSWPATRPPGRPAARPSDRRSPFPRTGEGRRRRWNSCRVAGHGRPPDGLGLGLGLGWMISGCTAAAW